MDDDSGLGIRNWGCYYEPSLKGNLALQLMSSVAERDTKSFLSGRDPSMMVGANRGFHHRDCGVSESPIPTEFVRDGWIHQREKILQMLPGNSNYSVLSETSGTQAMHMVQQPQPQPQPQPPPPPPPPQPPSSSKDEESGIKKDGPLKKRQSAQAPKSPKTKKAKKVGPKDETNSSVKRATKPRKNTGVVINGIDMDTLGIPIPVCSCTGIPQQCYRWGCGGWQSACCTTSVSIYPLPMSTKRRGARIAGRKMSQGAFKKVLEKLAAEGYNLSNPIDLKTYWAKHGTNKFVTIR